MKSKIEDKLSYCLIQQLYSNNEISNRLISTSKVKANWQKYITLYVINIDTEKYTYMQEKREIYSNTRIPIIGKNVRLGNGKIEKIPGNNRETLQQEQQTLWKHAIIHYITINKYDGFQYYLSLVRFNGTVNTIRSFWCQGCVHTDVLSGKHKIKSAVLIRLLTQTIEAPKKRNRDCQE